jgi:hypothetical protein
LKEKRVFLDGQPYHLDTNKPIGDLTGRICAANAYMGGWGIAAALAEGADIINLWPCHGRLAGSGPVGLVARLGTGRLGQAGRGTGGRPHPFERVSFEKDGYQGANLSGYGETVRVPLGEAVFARAGDKGGSANLGVWCRRPEAFAWLAAFLTKDRLAALLGLPPRVVIKRYELSNVNGILFVLENYFGTSGTGNIGLDQIGKSLGEFLRSRILDIPKPFLADPSRRRGAE